MPKPPKSDARPTVVARVDDDAAAIALTAAERAVLEEALRLGAELADEVESKVNAYGRWLLARVFDNDSKAALDERTENPLWLELVRRAGGPTLRINRKMLSIALRMAAYDRRIGDQTWRRLDVGRKELLLPLADDKRLREAAQHVSKFNLTHAKTRAYVASLREEVGKGRGVRLTGPLLVSRLRKLRESLDGKAVVRKLRVMKAELDPAGRKAITAEIEQLRELLSSVAREIRS